MIRFFLALAVITVSSFASAQKTKFNFKLGEEYELPRRTEDLAFFGNDKDGIVNLSLKKDELIITRFNASTLAKTLEQKIDLDATRNFSSEIVADFNNGNYYWLHSDWDKGSETESLTYDKVDVSKGKIIESDKPLIQSTKIAGVSPAAAWGWVPQSSSVSTSGYKVTGKYNFEYDADKKKLLISYRLMPESRNDKKNYDKIGLHVFGEDMKKLWGGEFTMPYTEAIMDNEGFSVDSKGNAYMLAKVFDNESRRERDKSTGAPAYHFEVFKFSKDSKKIAITKVSVGEYFIGETTITENAMHDMIIACTYSKKAKGDNTDGVFLATLDQNDKLVKFKNGYYEFPLEELQKFESNRTRRRMGRKDDYEQPNLKVRDVQIEADGSMFLTCEEYRMVVRTTTTGVGGSMSSNTTVTYYYDDILGCKIDASGKFEWVRKIPKRQVGGGADRGTMGFKLITDATGYYILYLDNIKNLNLAEDEVPKVHRDGLGGQVILSRITKDGKHEKELLFDTRDEDVMIFPSQFSRMTGNRFIGRAKVKKKLFRPLLITMK